MQLLFKEVTNQSELDSILALRRDVFIIEQEIDPKLEFDEFDYLDNQNSKHFVVLCDNNIAATARLLINDSYLKIGRVCTKNTYRKQGIASYLISQITTSYNSKPIQLASQYNVVDFYKKIGFETFGSTFYDAGILHINMEYGGNNAQ